MRNCDEREQLARQEAELQKRLLYSLFMQAPTLIAVLRGPDHRSSSPIRRSARSGDIQRPS